MNSGVVHFLLAINYLVNNIDIENVLDVDLVGIDPYGFSKFPADIQGVGDDHQYPESPFLMFKHGCEEFIGMVIGKDYHIVNVMPVSPEIFKYFVGNQPEAIQ